MIEGIGYLFGGERGRGCQQQKGAFEGLNGPSVCFMQRRETVDYCPRGFSVPQEMSLCITLLWERRGQIVTTSGV
jgi:hypothetical protein